MPPGQTGRFPRLKGTMKKRPAEHDAGADLIGQPNSSIGIGRFSQQGQYTEALRISQLTSSCLTVGPLEKACKWTPTIESSLLRL